MMGLAAASLALLAACAGGATPEERVSAEDAGPHPDQQRPEPPRPPRFAELLPAPSSFVAAEDAVAVAGRAVPGDHPIDRLLVAGQDLALDASGRFELQLPASSEGVNLVELRVEDEGGERAVELVSYHSGPVNPPGAVLPRALTLQASQEAIDDADPDPDDLASLMARLMVQPSFLALLQRPYEFSGLSVTPTQIALGRALVMIDLEDGGLWIDVVLEELELHFAGSTGDEEEEDGGFSGRVDVAALAFGARVRPGRDETGRITAEIQDVVIEEPEGFQLALNELEDWPPAVQQIISDALQSYLVSQLAEELPPLLGESLTELLHAFALQYTLGEEDPVELRLAVSDLQARREALTVVFDASAEALHTVQSGLGLVGSLHTPGAPPAQLEGSEPVLAAIDDDFINQLLFASWYGGALRGWRFEMADLARAGEGAAEIPPPFGPLDAVTLSGLLPFTLVPAQDPAFLFDFVVGDLGLDIVRSDEARFRLRLGLRAGARLVFGEGTSLGLSLDNRPRNIQTVFAVDEAPPLLDPGDLAALGRLMVPRFLAEANEIAGEQAIPPIPLSSLGDIDALSDQVLQFHAARAERTGPAGDHLLIGGRFEVTRQPAPEPP